MCLFPIVHAITRHVPIGSENMGPVVSRKVLNESLTVLEEELYDPSLGHHDPLVGDVQPHRMDLRVIVQGYQSIPIIPNTSEKLI